MKHYWIYFYIFLALSSCSTSNSSDEPDPDPDPDPTPSEFIRGVDISFLPQIEANGYTYINANYQPQDALTIFKQSGVNVVRLRLWKNPSNTFSSFNEVKNLSQRIKNNGLKVWLTVHYSDTWADPGNQQLPQQWQNLTLEVLKDSVYTYTKKIMTEIQPHYIQIGNEINSGFLWPQGQINNLSAFKSLLTEGLQAVRDHSSTTKTMIHYAGYSGAQGFFNNLTELDFDIIGLSYYPWWHGDDLNSLQVSMTSLRQSFNKNVIIAETAYPFTLEWNDWTNNIIGQTNQLHPDYDATIAGQMDFMTQLRQISEDAEGIGFCYWAPEWTAFDGDTSTDGSAWENLALFDFTGKVVPAISVFNQ